MPNPQSLGNPAWKPGVSGNPAGMAKTGYQRPADRIPYILNTHSIDEIISTVQDKKAFGKLSGIDGLCYARIAYALGKDGTNDTKLLWDRAYGTPESLSKVAILMAEVPGVDAAIRISKADADANLMLAKLGGLIAGGVVHTGESPPDDTDSNDSNSGSK